MEGKRCCLCARGNTVFHHGCICLTCHLERRRRQQQRYCVRLVCDGYILGGDQPRCVYYMKREKGDCSKGAIDLAWQLSKEHSNSRKGETFDRYGELGSLAPHTYVRLNYVAKEVILSYEKKGRVVLLESDAWLMPSTNLTWTTGNFWMVMTLC